MWRRQDEETNERANEEIRQDDETNEAVNEEIRQIIDNYNHQIRTAGAVSC